MEKKTGEMLKEEEGLILAGLCFFTAFRLEETGK